MNNKTLIYGAILIFLGLFFLGRTMEIFWFSFGDLLSFLFPSILIIIGIRMIMKKKREERNSDGFSTTIHVKQSQTDSSGRGDSGDFNWTSDQELASPITNGNNKLKYNKMFGDIFIDFQGLSLQNVVVTTFIGDTELKLHGGLLSKGLNRLIVSGFIGDVRILIPKEMAVFSQCSNFIGDIELMGRHTSGFGNNIDAQTPNYQSAESKLYISSNHFIGDIRVYSV